MATRVAICLFEDAITKIDISDLLTGQPLTKVALDKPDADVELFLKESNDSTPEWANILGSFSKIDIKNTITASSGAILFIKVKKRVLACCFGTSVANINKDNMVTDFGLAVAYYRISKRNYKGIQTFTLTENPITNNRSAAMPSSRNNFNLDSYLETITELTGKFFSSKRDQLVKGKEFFSIPSPLNLDDLKKLGAEILDEYEKTTQNADYKRLTAVSKVKTKKLIEYLNDSLCAEMNKKSKSVYLVDYQQNESINSYSLTLKGQKFSELDISDLYNDINKTQKFSTAYLKSRHISVFDVDDQEIDSWSLYKCLFIELSLNIGGHIFYKGNWYEVQKRFITDLKDYISLREINSNSLKLPQWDEKQNEGDYNSDAAKKINGQCWDKTLYRHPEYTYGIEFCDILIPKYVIHVKKLGSSSLNSHLLMQTFVSAQLLKSDPLIRKWIKVESNKKFKKNIFLKASNEFKETPVKYLIALMSGKSSKSLTDRLPFFSLVTFNMMIRRIEQLDYDVEICYV